MKQRAFMSNYMKQFDTFNEDLILNVRKRDKIETYLDEMWREIARHVKNNIEYMGYHYDDSGRRFRELNAGKDKTNSGKKTMSIYETAARLCVFEFKLTNLNQQTGAIETIYVETPIYIPLYCDNYHFLIAGSKYSAPYQIADAITYTNRSNMVVLKTKTRAIKLAREKKANPITDVHGNKFNSCYVYYLYMTSKKTPFLLYYFAYFGFMNTFKFFGADYYCKFYTDCPLEPDEKNFWFKFGSIYIAVDREAFGKYYNLREFIFTVLECQKRNMDQDSIENTTRWKIILGSTISESNALEKGEGLVRTLRISLDARTRTNIEKLVGGAKKDTMWTVIRWMFLSFVSLSSKTNSLLNKRIRVSEWIVEPLLRERYDKLYRFLGTPEKSRDMNRLADIVKCPEGFILGAICGKNRKGLTLDIAKWASGVNDNAICKDGLRYVTNGPGSPGSSSSGGSKGGSSYRVFGITYVGRLDIYTSSNSDPGTSGMMSPFAKVNLDTLTFEKEV